MGRLLVFGKIMLRLSPPGRELILQSPRFDVWVAGVLHVLRTRGDKAEASFSWQLSAPRPGSRSC